jgi:hypothetical protein
MKMIGLLHASPLKRDTPQEETFLIQGVFLWKQSLRREARLEILASLLYKNTTGLPIPEQIEAFCDTWELDYEKSEMAYEIPKKEMMLYSIRSVDAVLR